MTERDGLLELLNAAVALLYGEYKPRGQSVAVFLHQSLALHADTGTLERVIADVRDELARLQEYGSVAP